MIRPGNMVGGAVLAAALAGIGLQAIDSFRTAPALAATSVAGDDVVSPISGFAFGAIEVPIGATVTWRNDDEPRHTVTATDQAFSSGPLASGATFTQRFTTAGTFTYVCELHRSMTGKVVVNDAGSASPDPYANG